MKRAVKKTLALFLAFALCVSFYPAAALAEDAQEIPTPAEETAVPPEETSGEALEEPAKGTGSLPLNELIPSEESQISLAAANEESAELEALPNPGDDSQEANLPLSGECGDNLTWTLDADGQMNISGSGDMWDWIWDWDNPPVPWAEDRQSMTSLVIGEGVTSIGNYAFCDCCNLKNVSIPNTVSKIGDDAFQCCYGLESLVIPESVQSIGNSAFCGCEALEEIHFEGSAPEFGDGIFSGVTATAYYPAENETWTEEVRASCGSGITWVPVSSALYSGECGDNLTWTLGADGVLTISGSGDIYNYNLEYVPWMEQRDQIREIVIQPGVSAIGQFAFAECSAVESVTIPESVQWIRYAAFQGCSSLSEVRIPGSVMEISQFAFAECSALEIVTLPEGLNGLDEGVFRGCRELESITIPASVTYIHTEAFTGCSGLREITVAENNPVYSSEDGVLYDRDKNMLLKCPEGKTGALTIPDSVYCVEWYAFSGTAGLTSVTMPQELNLLSSWAFADSGVQRITFTGNCPGFGEEVFLHVTATVYYPGWGWSWDNATQMDHGGSITWEAYYPPVSGSCGDDLTWTLREGGVLTISGTGEMDVFSETGHPWGEYSNDIRTLVIEEGLSSISCNAFGWCGNLESVTIPGTVRKIESEAFFECSALRSVIIPEGVESIGPAAFGWCEKLESVTIPGSVKSIGEGAFYCCKALSGLTLPEGLESLGGYAFSGCDSLTTVTLPASLTELGEDTFFACSSLGEILAAEGNPAFSSFDGALYNKEKTTLIFCPEGKTGTLTIPADTAEIHEAAFTNCPGLTAFQVEEGNTSFSAEDGILYNAEKTVLIRCPEGKTGTLTIPASVTEYEEDAFLYCDGLTAFQVEEGNTSFSAEDGILYNAEKTVLIRCLTAKTGAVTIPAGVVRIEAYAFQGCSGISSVSLPEGVTELGDGAFFECSGLTGIVLPESTEELGTWTFCDCTSLESVTIPKRVTRIGEGLFNGCSSLSQAIIPEGVTSIGDSAFLSCTSLESVSIPGSVGSIGEDAFYYCPELKTLTIGDGVKGIGGHAFCDCSSLESVTIPGSVESIGVGAFQNCSAMTSLTMEAGAGDLAPYAFAWCSSLESVTIPGSVKSIGEHAFESCSQLKNLTLEEGVEGIDSYAFYSCESLESLTIPGSVASIGEFAFQACYSLESVAIPGSVTSIGEYAFLGCSRMKSLTLENGIKSIGDYAFGSCVNLGSVTIPGSVTSIGTYAFGWSGYLSVIRFEGDAPEIGEEAFNGANATAYYPEGNESWTEDVRQSYGGVTEWVAYESLVILTLEAGEGDYWRLTLPILNGSAVGALPVPYLGEEYSFDGWFTADGAKVEEDRVFDADVTLYGRWHRPGDVNGDGKVSTKDFVTLMKFLAGEEIPVVETALDVNGDGKASTKDFVTLMKYLAGEDIQIH